MPGIFIFPIAPDRPAILPDLAIVAATAFTSLCCAVFALVGAIL
ncbi:hypothetical protein [Neorhizobium alkalisoli]|uniref:Uncharacterized protein n=1 Tax=Neorhizobium alkalisoli TaxID=528178 RepID=A0A561QSD4_9HYPH|nr:hypothetical protein [Neorhizobium alkalisoli]TWF53239.1 hypothetical protein FHW37_104516 [Neorhizobium alkalisoli]